MGTLAFQIVGRSRDWPAGVGMEKLLEVGFRKYRRSRWEIRSMGTAQPGGVSVVCKNIIILEGFRCAVVKMDFKLPNKRNTPSSKVPSR